jgi:hypothetical protein
MNLYLLTQKENSGWDTYDSVVVAAKNEQEAKKILPSEYSDWNNLCGTWASSPENVTVEYIGKAKEGTVKGVVLASFNAG